MDTKRTALRDLPELVSPQQAAPFAGCSARQVTRLCQNGEFKAVRVGKLWRINRDALIERLGL